jgi:hypothetical protein
VAAQLAESLLQLDDGLQQQEAARNKAAAAAAAAVAANQPSASSTCQPQLRCVKWLPSWLKVCCSLMTACSTKKQQQQQQPINHQHPAHVNHS